MRAARLPGHKGVSRKANAGDDREQADELPGRGPLPEKDGRDKDGEEGRGRADDLVKLPAKGWLFSVSAATECSRVRNSNTDRHGDELQRDVADGNIDRVEDGEEGELDIIGGS
jgi:hypothetical protein